MFKYLFLFAILVFAVVTYNVVESVAPGAITTQTNNCYDLLNAAGQVVQTVCH